MKKIFILTLSLFATTLLVAQEKIEISKWLKTEPIEVKDPAFSNTKNINGEKYYDADLLKDVQINLEKNPRNDQIYALLGKDTKWKEYTLKEDSILSKSLKGKNLIMLSTYLELDQWAEVNLSFTTNALFELYIDGEKKHSKNSTGINTENVKAELHQGKHQVTLKLITKDEEIKFHSKFSYDKEQYPDLVFNNTFIPDRTINIHDILDGMNIQSSSLSASGKYLLVQYSDVQKGSGSSVQHTVIEDLDNETNLLLFRNKEVNQIKWLPDSDVISYTMNVDGKTNIYMYDVEMGKETELISGIENFSSYQWSPNGKEIVYSVNQKADDSGELKRIHGNEDRIPGFRDRSYLYLLDIRTGDTQRLTAGNLSTHIHDFSPEGDKIIFSRSYPDYTEPPFSKQNLYEMDLHTFEVDTIWKDKQYSGWVQYSPDGKQLLVQGGPLLFGDVGVNVSEDKTPNNYDGQLYLFDPAKKEAKSITLDFKPAVANAKWLIEDEIYMVVNERDYITLYKYDVSKSRFEKVETNVEVIDDVDFAKNKPLAVYRGTSISTPEQMYMVNLESSISTLLETPKKEQFTDIKFGNTEEWNFTNKRGTEIYGRIYYPPNYNEDKKYPVIVYYYGGTSPVERSFDGRYPKNIWTANGYIVYVLQPSGATGFGQEFSALHVNGWGKEQLDDIIEGTKKFLDAHPSADRDNVGAIGASYGGYTTMMLQTQTDLFKTAVAHAGISSITSYWGEGYWGYTYNAVAAYNSYPWNNQEVYVENSPLYNADKFNNSILLLHGTADTNVPVGESKQFYAALKILGKDAEMVLVEDQNHWIVDYSKRIKWHHTIMSWFDKKLKDEPQLWNNMYPEKNLR